MSPRPITVGIASRDLTSDSSDERAAIEAAGARLKVFQASDDASLIEGLRDVDLVMNRRHGRFDAKIIGQLDRCRAIVQPSTGYD
ncbi:MAG: hypothetical protein ACRDIY_16425, partial [Chloroflexota bacterium]